MSAFARVVAVTAVLVSQVALAAPGWAQTFTADLVGTYFDRGANVMIVPAGPGSVALDGATAAFDAALRASGKAQLVMDARSLGPVAELDDAKIVAKAKAFPVAYVAVLRVFGGSGGASAVITVYDKKGAAAFALSGNEGTPLSPRAGGSGGMAVSTASASTGKAEGGVVSGVVGSSPAPSSAQDEFEQKVIFFEDYRTVGMNQYGSVVSSYDWARAYQGKYKKPLLGVDFYQALGKPEVVQKYRDVESSNTMWGIAGGVVFAGTLVGGIVWAMQPEADGGHAGFNLLGGILLASTSWLIGAIVAMIGHSDPDPYDMPTKRKMVDEYNTALKQRLQVGGLPSSEPVAVGAEF